MPPPSRDPAITVMNSQKQQSLMGTGPDETVMIWEVYNGALAFTTERVASSISWRLESFIFSCMPTSASTIFQWIS